MIDADLSVCFSIHMSCERISKEYIKSCYTLIDRAGRLAFEMLSHLSSFGANEGEACVSEDMKA